jgi:hypothetical protein
VNAVMNLWVPKMLRSFWVAAQLVTSWALLSLVRFCTAESASLGLLNSRKVLVSGRDVIQNIFWHLLWTTEEIYKNFSQNILSIFEPSTSQIHVLPSWSALRY